MKNRKTQAALNRLGCGVTGYELAQLGWQCFTPERKAGFDLLARRGNKVVVLTIQTIDIFKVRRLTTINAVLSPHQWSAENAATIMVLYGLNVCVVIPNPPLTNNELRVPIGITNGRMLSVEQGFVSNVNAWDLLGLDHGIQEIDRNTNMTPDINGQSNHQECLITVKINLNMST
jgi:hypothetical protein